jgi:hypothetical protein
MMPQSKILLCFRTEQRRNASSVPIASLSSYEKEGYKQREAKDPSLLSVYKLVVTWRDSILVRLEKQHTLFYPPSFCLGEISLHLGRYQQRTTATIITTTTTSPPSFSPTSIYYFSPWLNLSCPLWMTPSLEEESTTRRANNNDH